MIKKLLALFLVVLMSIDSFAALISDNDGSAFVTKGEFDALKKSFANQINSYDKSIADKIDGAIANYLAGTRLTKKIKDRPIISGKIYAFDNSDATKQLRYVYRPPALKGTLKNAQWSDVNSSSMPYGNTAMYTLTIQDGDHNRFLWWQTKCCVSDVDKVNNIAAWKGRYWKAYDEIDVSYANWNMADIDWGTPHGMAQLVHTSPNLRIIKDTDLYGQHIFELYTGETQNADANTIVNVFVNSISNHWGNRENANLILIGNSVEYDCFSNMDENRNFRYDGTHENLKNSITSTHNVLNYVQNGLWGISTVMLGTYANAHTTSTRVVTGSRTTLNVQVLPAAYKSNSTSRTTSTWKNGDVWYWPMIGFETNYITNWNQLYAPNLDSLANRIVSENIKGKDSLMQDSLGRHHIPLTAGLPLIVVKEDQKVELDITIQDYSLNVVANDSNYGHETLSTPAKTYIWAKTSPFTSNDPNSEADIKITTGNGVSKSTDSNYNNGVYITTSTATLKFDELNENCCIWLKWSTNNKDGGGVLTVPNEITVEVDT